MSTAIPDFDHNLVLPPHLGDPRRSDQLSPYPCTTLALCERFATSSKRKEILIGFLAFRERIHDEGVVNGFQWIDGSFTEDIETQEGRPPGDIDVVTFYWGYDNAFQQRLVVAFPEFADFRLSKAVFHVDHYPMDAAFHPALTVDQARCWAMLFSHNRQGVWKGMLRVELNTPAEDKMALKFLQDLQL